MHNNLVSDKYRSVSCGFISYSGILERLIESRESSFRTYVNAVLLAPMIACNIEYTKLKKQALYPDYQHKVRTLKSSNIAIAYSLYFASEALGIRRQAFKG